MEKKRVDIENTIKKSLKVMLGIFISSLGAVFMFKSGLGSAPPATIIEGTKEYFNLTYGMAALFINIFFLSFMILFDRSIIYIGTIVVGLSSGPMIDIANNLMDLILPNFEISLLMKFLFVIIGSILAGIGTGYYISEDFGIGTLEGIMIILNKRLNIPMVYSKWILDIGFIVIGSLMGASWGLGTVISIIVVGPVMMYIINLKKNKKVVDNSKNN